MRNLKVVVIMQVLVTFLLAGAAVGAPVSAGGSLVKFKKLLAAFQENQSNELREKIIALSLTIQPKPTIPNDAKELFKKAVLLEQTDSGSDGHQAAADQYKAALLKAPWWGNAYYNAALSLTQLEEYDDAVAALRFYLLTKPKKADVKNAQDSIEALELLSRFDDFAARAKRENKRTMAAQPEMPEGNATIQVEEVIAQYAAQINWLKGLLEQSKKSIQELISLLDGHEHLLSLDKVEQARSSLRETLNCWDESLEQAEEAAGYLERMREANGRDVSTYNSSYEQFAASMPKISKKANSCGSIADRSKEIILDIKGDLRKVQSGGSH